MRITLPFPPSTNSYYRNTPQGTKISEKGRKYKLIVMAEVLEQHGLFKPFTGPVKITVELVPPDKRRRDLDNFAGKALYDALEHANVFMNDSQIKESHNYMLEPGEESGCTVIVEPLE